MQQQRFLNYGSMNSTNIDNIVSEKEKVLEQLAKNRVSQYGMQRRIQQNKIQLQTTSNQHHPTDDQQVDDQHVDDQFIDLNTNSVSNSTTSIINTSTDIRKEFNLICEIMENKGNLSLKLNSVIGYESKKNLSLILDNHKTYAKLIDEYVENLLQTKIEIEKCTAILESHINPKIAILEINIKSKTIGKINDIKYEENFDNKTLTHTLRFDMKDVNNKVKILDNNKRQLILHMIYDSGVVIIYNIKFDMSTIDQSTGIVKGIFSSMRQ